jgi:hypothetical protein
LAQRPQAGVPAKPALARGQAPEEPKKPRTLPPVLPSPDRLGIVTAAPSPQQLGIGGSSPAVTAPLDWNATRKRLQDLGALSFQLERPAADAYRFTITLPTAQLGKPYHVEGAGGTEVEAVQAALAKADKYRTATP